MHLNSWPERLTPNSRTVFELASTRWLPTTRSESPADEPDGAGLGDGAVAGVGEGSSFEPASTGAATGEPASFVPGSTGAATGEAATPVAGTAGGTSGKAASPLPE